MGWSQISTAELRSFRGFGHRRDMVGLVPQQPPMMSAPAAMSSGTRAAISSGVSLKTRFAVFVDGQAGVGVDENGGMRRGGAHFSGDLDHVGDAVAAVGADDVRAGLHRFFRRARRELTPIMVRKPRAPGSKVKVQMTGKWYSPLPP